MLVAICLWTTVVFAQRDVDQNTEWSIKDRGYLGMGFGGLGFGSSAYGNYFSAGVTPLAGFMLAKNFSGGLAFEYQFTSYSDPKLRLHQYGWYPFLRYNIRNFFLQTDYDWYSIPLVAFSGGKGYTADRVMDERFFVGIGYTSGDPNRRGAVNFLVSYDFMYTAATSRFNSPVSIRIFATF